MRRVELVVGSFALTALLWSASAAAQQESILRIEGRITHVSPWEMVVEIDDGPVVMVDVGRIPQGELRQMSQNDYVVVTGFIRRPSHKIFATEIRRITPWLPMVPRWAPQSP